MASKVEVKRAMISERTNFYGKGQYVQFVVSGLTFSQYQSLQSPLPVILTRINLG